MKKVTLLALCITLSMVSIQAKNESYSMIYKAKRFLGPSSVKQLSKMSQAEKDKELRFYLQQEAAPYTGLSITKSKAMQPITFQPRAKYLKEIMYLIQHGASPNCEASYRWELKFVSVTGTFKPIYLFLDLGDEENVRILLDHGATLDNVIQSHGSIADPLAFAKTTSMATLLLEHGAQISAAVNQIAHPFYFGNGGLERFYSLVEVLLVDEDFDAELIPLYCSRYEGDVTEFAQAVWNQRFQKKRMVYLPNHRLHTTKIFSKKTNYLKDAGALLN